MSPKNAPVDELIGQEFIYKGGRVRVLDTWTLLCGRRECLIQPVSEAGKLTGHSKTMRRYYFLDDATPAPVG